MNVETVLCDSPVVVVSDNGLMATGLSTILSTEFRQSVEQSSSLEDAMSMCRKRGGPKDCESVIVFDLTRTGGVADESPAALTAATAVARVIAIVPNAPFDRVQELFELGVCGVVGSDAEPHELAHAIGEAAEGNVIASRRVLRDLVEHVIRCPNRADVDPSEMDSLPPREQEIVSLLMRGMTNREIAADLHLSEATVKAHLGRVMTRWQVHDRLQVVLRALGRMPQPL